MHHLHGFIGTCTLVLEVSVSHGDSAISHPRDQYYLSLSVGKGREVELQQALAYMVANIRKRERENKQRNGREDRSDQEVILKLLTFKHNSKTVFTSWTPPERDHHGYKHGFQKFKTLQGCPNLAHHKLSRSTKDIPSPRKT